MSDRRNHPANRWGCKPSADVCVQHDQPLVCRHGCDEVRGHQCLQDDPLHPGAKFVNWVSRGDAARKGGDDA